MERGIIQQSRNGATERMCNDRDKEPYNECWKTTSISMPEKTGKVQEDLPNIQNDKTNRSNRDLPEDDRTHTAEKDKRHHNRRDIRRECRV